MVMVEEGCGGTPPDGLQANHTDHGFARTKGEQTYLFFYQKILIYIVSTLI